MAFDLRNIFAEFRQNRRLQERRGEVEELLGSAEDGTGLLADPSDVARQVEFAGGLEALGPGQGTAFLGSILGNVAAGERQDAANVQAGVNSNLAAETSRLNAADQIQQRESEFARSLQEDQFQFAVNTLSDQNEARITDQRARLGAAGPQFGTVGPGMVRISNPEFGTPIDVALPGSKASIDAAAELGAQQQAIDSLEQFLDVFDRVGTEFSSVDGAVMQQHRARAISAVARLDNLGVLQAGELERIEATLPDPTNFFRGIQSVAGGVPILNTITGSNKTIRQGYQTLKEQFEFQHGQTQERFKFWPGLEAFQPAPIPEGFVPLEQQR